VQKEKRLESPENLNLDEYKELLLNKLKDSLEITGFNIDDLRLQLSQATTIAVNKFTGGNIRIER
jgi:hypothetical protein